MLICFICLVRQVPLPPLGTLQRRSQTAAAYGPLSGLGDRAYDFSGLHKLIWKTGQHLYIYIYHIFFHHLYSLVFHVLFSEHPFHQRQVAKSTSGWQSHSQRSCLSAKDCRGDALTNSIPMLYPHAFHISFLSIINGQSI